MTAARGRVAKHIWQPRLGFTSEVIDAEARRRDVAVPRRTGIYLWDNMYFIQARLPDLGATFLRGAVMRSVDRDGVREPVDEARWEHILSRRSFRQRPRLWRDSRRLIQKVASRIESGNPIHLVLLETPQNPRFLEEAAGGGIYQRYTEKMESLAASVGATYLNVNDAAGLTAADYVDWIHLRHPPARDRYTDTLGAELAEILVREAILP